MAGERHVPDLGRIHDLSKDRMGVLAQLALHDQVRSTKPLVSRSVESVAITHPRQEPAPDVVTDFRRIQLLDDSRIHGIVFRENNNREVSSAVEPGRQRWNEELLIEFADSSA